MIESLQFVCYVRAQPQGSAKGFIVKGPHPRVAITSDNAKMKPFRHGMALAAYNALPQPPNSEPPAEGAVRLELDFYFAKPKSAKKRIHHTVKPDLDKLARASLDAFSGILYGDDAQVSELLLRKLYGVPERVEVRFRAAAEIFGDGGAPDK